MTMEAYDAEDDNVDDDEDDETVVSNKQPHNIMPTSPNTLFISTRVCSTPRRSNNTSNNDCIDTDFDVLL
jgi:hypothetical protein